MTTTDIKRLLYALPSPNCFAGPAPTKDAEDLPPWSESQIEAICLNNPAFAWLYVRTFSQRGEELPICVLNSAMRMAYDHIAHGDWYEHIIGAIALSYPGNHRKRAILNALLISRNATIETIAAWMKLDADVISAYGELFWNVRDRMDDRSYVSALVYPTGRVCASGIKKLPFEQQLLIAGYEDGGMAVLSLAGLVTRVEERKMRQKVKLPLDQLIYRKARIELEEGNAGAHVVSHAVRLLQERLRKQIETQTNDPLTTISFAESITETILTLQGPEIKARLEAQKCLVAEGGARSKEGAAQN